MWSYLKLIILTTTKYSFSIQLFSWMMLFLNHNPNRIFILGALSLKSLLSVTSTSVSHLALLLQFICWGHRYLSWEFPAVCIMLISSPSYDLTYLSAFFRSCKFYLFLEDLSLLDYYSKRQQCSSTKKFIKHNCLFFCHNNNHCWSISTV